MCTTILDTNFYAHDAGYIATMGLANESLQGNKNLFYLYRQAVKGSDALRTFALFLPWREDLNYLPAITVVPSESSALWARPWYLCR